MPSPSESPWVRAVTSDRTGWFSGDAAIVGFGGLVLLVASPFAAGGGRILIWSYMALVVLPLLGVAWVHRVGERRNRLATATSAPRGAVVASRRRVARRAAWWGVPWLLVALAAATTAPNVGLGLGSVVIATYLGIDARRLSNLEDIAGCRFYRARSRSWLARPTYTDGPSQPRCTSWLEKRPAHS